MGVSMTRQFSRGSEWRLWDLHIHAPGTKLNDAFKPRTGDIWDDYCRILEESSVVAFGITDYFSADTYYACKREHQKRYPRSQKVLFPNVELRTTDSVNAAGEEVNIHLIFNPFAPRCDRNIRAFLQHLETTRTVAGGSPIRAVDLTDYEEATTSKERILKALCETFGPDADLLEHVLLVTAANNDGLRPKRGAKRKERTSDEYDKFSDGFFGNANSTAYFLRTDRIAGETTDPKPALSGCDAHSLDDLDLALGKVATYEGAVIHRPTWIKADVTYEGLKQVVFEPASRVFIGDEPPVLRRVRQSPTKYLDSLFIGQKPGYAGHCGRWFENEEIPLNPELVAIIGNKGGGKSAVADIIGLLGNTHNQYSHPATGDGEALFSFLTSEKFLRAKYASYFEGELRWCGGPPDRKTLNARTDEQTGEKVEYLPQKYLEKICGNIEHDEFRRTLNEVVFGYVSEDERFGTHDIEQLIAYRTKQAETELATAQALVKTKNVALVTTERLLTAEHRRELEAKLRQRQQELASVPAPKEVQPPKGGASAEANADQARATALDTEIAAVSAEIERLEQEQTTLKKEGIDLSQSRQEIQRRVASLAELETTYADLFVRVGLRFTDVIAVVASYQPIDDALSKRRTRLTEIKAKLLPLPHIAAINDADTRARAEAASLLFKKTALEAERTKIVERLDKPQKDYQEYLRAKADWEKRRTELEGDEKSPKQDTVRWLQAEIAKLQSEYPEARRLAVEARDQSSRALYRKKRELVNFYDSIKGEIDRKIKECRDELGDYEMSIQAGLRFDRVFYEEFLKRVQKNVKGSFFGDGRILTELASSVTDWQDEDNVFAGLSRIFDALHNDIRPDEVGAIRDVFTQAKDPAALYDYLYGFSYLNPKYDLKVDNKDLEELSPGERGGLLLIFYLMLDKRDIPLVVDQPEDNLDNQSVAEILVTFIKKAKERRQIIIVTHNPNLAVFADAEQIINVSIDKKHDNDFTFKSGGIEDPEINQKVVDVLEGTIKAFDNRRIKYRK